jgi:glycosyltransferase involved in cell wall biosynthesis
MTCLGFQNQLAMAAVYRIVDLLLVPSLSETWGFAVQEALACGTPVWVSGAVGCGPDLVVPGENGAILRTADWADWAECLGRWHKGQLGSTQRAASIAARVPSHEVAARAMLESIQRVIGSE